MSVKASSSSRMVRLTHHTSAWLRATRTTSWSVDSWDQASAMLEACSQTSTFRALQYLSNDLLRLLIHTNQRKSVSTRPLPVKTCTSRRLLKTRTRIQTSLSNRNTQAPVLRPSAECMALKWTTTLQVPTYHPSRFKNNLRVTAKAWPVRSVMQLWSNLWSVIRRP